MSGHRPWSQVAGPMTPARQERMEALAQLELLRVQVRTVLGEAIRNGGPTSLHDIERHQAIAGRILATLEDVDPVARRMVGMYLEELDSR